MVFKKREETEKEGEERKLDGEEKKKFETPGKRKAQRRKDGIIH